MTRCAGTGETCCADGRLNRQGRCSSASMLETRRDRPDVRRAAHNPETASGRTQDHRAINPGYLGPTASTRGYPNREVSAPAGSLRYTFQAGHEGLIPFARSNPKHPVSGVSTGDCRMIRKPCPSCVPVADSTLRVFPASLQVVIQEPLDKIRFGQLVPWPTSPRSGTAQKTSRAGCAPELARWRQERRVRRPVRISLTRISGCSRAAKCPPFSASP
jgi:hypothetical protein